MVSNVERGRSFLAAARDAVGRFLHVEFETETPIPIGHPARPHRFDLVSPDSLYVGEAKAFTWTASGNIPAAKITTLREAVAYLQALPASTRTFIVLLRSQHPRREESLGGYFARLNEHVLGASRPV